MSDVPKLTRASPSEDSLDLLISTWMILKVKIPQIHRIGWDIFTGKAYIGKITMVSGEDVPFNPMTDV